MKLAAFIVAITLLPGCTMFKAWKSIPPPGGCDQCHTVAISNNWQVAYASVSLTDERNRLAFQTPQQTIPDTRQPESSLELRKVQESKCFECHRAPNSAHTGRKGRYHH